MTVGLVQAEEDLAALLEHVGSDRRPAACAEMARSADPGGQRRRRPAGGPGEEQPGQRRGWTGVQTR